LDILFKINIFYKSFIKNFRVKIKHNLLKIKNKTDYPQLWIMLCIIENKEVWKLRIYGIKP